jgi:hypothetical protein
MLKTTLVIYATIGCIGFGCVSPANSPKSLYPKLIVRSARTLSIWMSATLRYQYDKEEIWKTPEQTVNDKGGDCEDFAFLSKHILEDLNYKNVKVIILRNRKYKMLGHAICIFREKDRTWGIMNNQFYDTTKEKDLPNMLKAEFPDYDTAWETDFNKNKKLIAKW